METPAWSPYVVGAGIGVLLCLTMYFAKHIVGASTSYAMAAGLIGKAVAPVHTARRHYFQENPPKVSWEFVFIGATLLGGFLAAWHGGELANRWLPTLWVERFGEGSLGGRAAAALLGGALMAFGARMAEGCTSGHGISGAAQLNVGSWIALVCFFIGGVIVAHGLYGL